jgi:hypothetical protein
MRNLLFGEQTVSVIGDALYAVARPGHAQVAQRRTYWGTRDFTFSAHARRRVSQTDRTFLKGSALQTLGYSFQVWMH